MMNKRFSIAILALFITLLFHIEGFAFQKKLKKAVVLVRSEKVLSLSGKKLFIIYDSSFSLTKEESKLRDSIIQNVMRRNGADIVETEEQADFLLMLSYDVKSTKTSVQIGENTKNSYSNPIDKSQFWSSFYRFNPDNNSSKRYDTSDQTQVNQYQEDPASIPKKYRRMSATKYLISDKSIRYCLNMCILAKDDSTDSLWDFQSVILSSFKHSFKDVFTFMLFASENYLGKEVGTKFISVNVKSTKDGLKLY